MINVEVRTPAQAVAITTQSCLHRGTRIAPRGLECWEVPNYSVQISEPWQVPFGLEGRHLSARVGATEAVQLVAGQPFLHLVRQHKGLRTATVDDSGTAHGNYGQRLYGQLEKVVGNLGKDPDSRQAVMTIYDQHRDLTGYWTMSPRDVPCTIAIQFMIRLGRLCTRVMMRSNDAFLGLPYDLLQFAALQGAVAACLEIPMGWYHHTVGSMHVYQKDAEAAGQIRVAPIPLNQFNEPVNPVPYRPMWSARTPAGIVETAEAIAIGDRPAGFRIRGTEFERWLAGSLAPS